MSYNRQLIGSSKEAESKARERPLHYFGYFFEKRAMHPEVDFAYAIELLEGSDGIVSVVRRYTSQRCDSIWR